MAIIAWSDDFKIGESEIDKEHWGLFVLIQDLGDKLARNAAEPSIHATMQALAGYVAVHFEHEERLMQETGYPGLEAHKKAHAALSARVRLFQEDLQRAPEAFNYRELKEFLSGWLSEHIRRLDMDFAAYHKKQQAA